MLRNINMLVLLVSATAWATLLVVGGGLLAVNSSIRIGPWTTTSVTLAGLAGVAAGIFVFEVVVADRLFPKAARRLPLAVEATCGVLMLLLTGAAIVAVFSSAA